MTQVLACHQIEAAGVTAGVQQLADHQIATLGENAGVQQVAEHQIEVGCGGVPVVDCDVYLNNVVLFKEETTYSDSVRPKLTGQSAEEFCSSKYCIDGYIQPTNVGSSAKYFWNISPTSHPNFVHFSITAQGALTVYVNGETITSADGLISNGVEYHVEVDVDGVNAWLFINGSLAGTSGQIPTTIRTGTVSIYYNSIFNLEFSNSTFAGTQRNFRVTKDINRHTEAFDVGTQVAPNLACQRRLP